MITAETITDEQIRGLRRAALHFDEVMTSLVCTVALGEDDESTAPERNEARARCAEILNARAK